MGEDPGTVVRVMSGVGSGLVGGGLYGAIKSAWMKPPGVEAVQANTMQLVRGNALLFAGVGGTYAVVRSLTNDIGSETTSSMIAGAAAGASIGVAKSSLNKSVGFAALTAFLIGANSLFQDSRDPEKVARRWQMS